MTIYRIVAYNYIRQEGARSLYWMKDARLGCYCLLGRWKRGESVAAEMVGL